MNIYRDIPVSVNKVIDRFSSNHNRKLDLVWSSFDELKDRAITLPLSTDGIKLNTIEKQLNRWF